MCGFRFIQLDRPNVPLSNILLRIPLIRNDFPETLPITEGELRLLEAHLSDFLPDLLDNEP